jgi:hypothetical protein
MSMKESSTCQAILEEGRVEGQIHGAIAEARKVLRLLGEEAVGSPDARISAFIERLDDLAQLEGFLKRMRTAGGWQELFGQSTSGARTRRRRLSSR